MEMVMVASVASSSASSYCCCCNSLPSPSSSSQSKLPSWFSTRAINNPSLVHVSINNLTVNSRGGRRREKGFSYCSSSSSASAYSGEEDEEGEEEEMEEKSEELMMRTLLEERGGKMVAQLVGAFNQLIAHRNKNNGGAIKLTSSSLSQLFNTLKLAIPILHSLPVPTVSSLHQQRSPLSKALSVAIILADLQMDAEVISAGILGQVLEAGAMSLVQVRDRIGISTAHLLHESLRLESNISSKLHLLDDDDSAATLRKFCLTYYDFRALILHLALKLDTMRHLHYLPRYKQQLVSLEVIKLHAPLAHALDTYSASRFLSLELEDLSFRCLFPHSYLYLDTWLRRHKTGIATETKPLIESFSDQLHQFLSSDSLLMEMVGDISVKGRYKSRYSTMKKLLRDGRKPEEVNDIFGLRVILSPSQINPSHDEGEMACYRAREIIRSLWKEIPSRSKDYIMRPKANGYKSLHMAVEIGDAGGMSRPPMEIQIRTDEMDRLAADGTASHALYKSGLTDPEEAKRLKAIMIAAAELAAVRLEDLPSTNRDFEIERQDQVFSLLDKNNDGKISIEELTEVMEELGAQGEDARKMMLLLDSNSDGSLSSDEFDKFQKQVHVATT
ncbi:OLC1v1004218C2 [Oldenlandia corymbosa var. corymbosa]|uniref:GTP diphosphokinase n=1 Tax=Oldenlandia corymbosa var. corymbosa TaxID=529605 RepID=A0AAV1DC18_OLDCO|nr:OLC1v1004218C2 [Oldenlandia corymbosa var. corymbosa]